MSSNNDGSTGGGGGENTPLLRPSRSQDQLQQLQQQQQQQLQQQQYLVNQDPMMMAQYAAAAGNHMAAYALAASQYDASDYGATAAAGGGGMGPPIPPPPPGATTGVVAGGPYGGYYAPPQPGPGPYGYGPPPPGAGVGGMPPPGSGGMYYGAPHPIMTGPPPPGRENNNVNSNKGGPSRPPRASRRRSGGGPASKLSPSPTSSYKKTYVPEGSGGGGGSYQVQQQQQPPPIPNWNPDIIETNSSGSGIPNLADIFSDNSGGEELDIMGNGPYGSMGTQRRRSGSSTGTGGTGGRVQPVLVQTTFSNSSSDGKDTVGMPHPLKAGGGSNSTPNSSSNLQQQQWQPLPNKPAVPPRRGHRRANSDVPVRGRHRRLGSSDMPPKGGNVGASPKLGGIGGPPNRSRLGSNDGGNRNRTFSAGKVFDGHSSLSGLGSISGGMGGPPPTRGRHRRADSASSMMSFVSNASVQSIVSNIGKSAMFGGVTEKGQVQLHFPYEATRLVMINTDIESKKKKQSKKNKKKLQKALLYGSNGEPHQQKIHVDKRKYGVEYLEEGHLYQETLPTDPETFETYHEITTALQDGLTPNWESLDANVLHTANGLNICSCQCNNCNGCTGKQQLLPEPTYTLTIKDDVYRRIVSEIADAQSMPCGLFFCGHHEDVAYPSISIAVLLVIILFATLAAIAIYV